MYKKILCSSIKRKMKRQLKDTGYIIFDGTHYLYKDKKEDNWKSIFDGVSNAEAMLGDLKAYEDELIKKMKIPVKIQPRESKSNLNSGVRFYSEM